MKKCLDEGLIQAYADGELSPDAAREAEAHLAACAACAALLAEAEQSGAFFAAAFGPDASVAVPSEVLRARLEAAVARLEAAPESARPRRRGFDFGALFAPLAGLFSFTPQRAAAFASVLAVVAFAVVFLAVRERTAPFDAPQQIASGERPAPAPPAPAAEPKAEPKEVENDAALKSEPEVAPAAPRVLNAAAPRRAVNTSRRTRNDAPAPRATPAETPAEALVPGEQNYREAIASLEKVVAAGGDAVLVPSARIEYERSVAVLDRAIEETRRVALRNPKDKDAAGFLMAAYQSKVELLSTVADQTQVASVGR